MIDSFEEVVLDIHKRKHFNKLQATSILCEMDTANQYKNLISYINSQKVNLPVIQIYKFFKSV